MQCNACVEICPVGIEHVPIINLLRRNLVEQAEMPTTLQQMFEHVHRTGNSFGEPPRRRARWVKDAGLALPDARTHPVDVLWWVGDMTSFDPRNQRHAVLLTELLREAGMDVGILYEAERTAGNDLRRAGEEGLYRDVVDANLETLASCEFDRILTTDPHTFNTLRNEYPTLGASWKPGQVVHHTQLLLQLLEAERLAIRSPLGMRGTYHDPCALGRLNGVYDEPRDLIGRVGVEIAEMPRNRDQSYCCGAGGGRIWMPGTAAAGTRRPAEQRITRLWHWMASSSSSSLVRKTW